MIKAIIFDCFGVLVGDVFRTKAAELATVDPDDSEAIYGALKRMDLGLLSREEGVHEIAEAMKLPVASVVEMSNDGEVRNAPLIQIIPGLKGQYKVGLLSNVRSRNWLEDRFLPGELDELFDVVIASGDVGMIKPEPEIYHLMAQKLGVLPAECVMIDDSPSSVDGARAAGLQAIHYQNNQQVVTERHTLLSNTA